MILVVSSERDGHAKEVIARLRRKNVSMFLLDLSSFPSTSALTVGFDNLDGPLVRDLDNRGERLDFSRCRTIWWRRPQPFSLHEEIVDANHRTFALTEAHSAFSGLWLTLKAFWINHPTKDEEAARKVYQLGVAKEVGFRIPETCITNEPNRAREFVRRLGPQNTVYKAFSGTEQAWRETRVFRSGETDLLDNVRYTPVIFQEYIPGDADLRITVVGDQIFPAAIFLQDTEYEVDFRMVMDSARMGVAELPGEVVAMLREFMKRMGLVYGAIDMRRTPDGEYVFLEINPAGQWLFVEQRTGMPITDAMVELMVEKDETFGVKSNTS